jgi:hypothetical protein
MNTPPAIPFARTIRVLAVLSCLSLLIGFIGVATGLSETLFLLLVTCLSSLAGLVLLACVNLHVSSLEKINQPD